jgi:large subunit ribosomal protein L17
LVLHERIETTEAKGKELRALSDQMISLGIQGDIAARRAAAAFLLDPKAVSHLFSNLAPLFKAPATATPAGGGYTRLIKTRIRYGDAAPMVIVEFTKRSAAAEEPAPPEKKAAPKTEKETEKAEDEKKAVASA